jgi:two-component system alkaline phosphatase synthesis response regulator PhoP
MSRKILVVEDDADLLELLRLHFKDGGFAIATASDGIEAVKKARSLRPDLIVLDLMIPELDGLAVCEILRNDETTASIPVIMVSGLPGQVTQLAGMESGATDFIRKPFSPGDMLSRVEELLKDVPISSDTGMLWKNLGPAAN